MEIRRRPPNPSVTVENLEYSIHHDEAKPRNILEKIVWEKEREVKISRQKVSLEKLQTQILSLPNPKKFVDSLRAENKLPAVIAEIKKASPSKGIIRSDFNPTLIAKDYEEGGATCISVLTDTTFFKGGFDVLIEVRKKVKIPLLCKDFILFPYQIYQARASGADAILFIAAILSDQDLIYLNKIASSLELDILVEVHNSIELKRVLSLGIFRLIGINNRDLATFEVDLGTTEKLISEYKDQLSTQDVVLVSESGLFTRADLDRVAKIGANAVLVGESLMRQPDIKSAIRNLIN